MNLQDFFGKYLPNYEQKRKAFFSEYAKYPPHEKIMAFSDKYLEEALKNFSDADMKKRADMVDENFAKHYEDEEV
ncbi:MAG: hypothetical protein LBE36_13545 [Flavobacteriaceae bacterium]|nr:hypothetical protein [Flavobacteriaceae bacterium]